MDKAAGGRQCDEVVGARLVRRWLTRRHTVALRVGVVCRVGESTLVGFRCWFEVDAERIGSEKCLVHN